ncbi:DUF1819 family protein [Oenococcus sp.]|uniref:DUF1819 family protein n=1 Tax=Oenococcus sp. TaxID=1979414 RepID=UPI0039EAC288
MKKYTSTAVSYAFWFSELSSILDLLANGLNFDDIKYKAFDENYFQLTATKRTEKMYHEVIRRVKSLSESMQQLFPLLDSDNQRLVNLIAIMNTTPLVETFMTTVFRDEIVLGDYLIEPREFNGFFMNLQASHSEVASWTDQTIKRLERVIKNFLREARLVETDGDNLKIKRSLLDPRLEDLLRKGNKTNYVQALVGR